MKIYGDINSAADNLRINILKIQESIDATSLSKLNIFYQYILKKKNKILPAIDKLKTLKYPSEKHKTVLVYICNKANSLATNIAQVFIKSNDERFIELAHVPLLKYIDVLSYNYLSYDDEPTYKTPFHFLMKSHESAFDSYYNFLDLHDIEDEEMDKEIDKLLTIQKNIESLWLIYETVAETSDIIEFGIVNKDIPEVIKMYENIIGLLRSGMAQFETMHTFIGNYLSKKEQMPNHQIEYAKYIYKTTYEPKLLIDYMTQLIKKE